jgi:hypothetical protein
MTKTEAFRAFNIKLLNTRWSWSGISDDKKHVASTIWTDECKWNKEKRIYLTEVTEEWNYNWKSDKGNIERIKHFKHCIKELDSMFWVVFVKPKEIIFDEPREAENHSPYTSMMFKLTSFREDTGIFASESIPETMGKYEETFQ